MSSTVVNWLKRTTLSPWIKKVVINTSAKIKNTNKVQTYETVKHPDKPFLWAWRELRLKVQTFQSLKWALSPDENCWWSCTAYINYAAQNQTSPPCPPGSVQGLHQNVSAPDISTISSTTVCNAAVVLNGTVHLSLFTQSSCSKLGSFLCWFKKCW